MNRKQRRAQGTDKGTSKTTTSKAGGNSIIHAAAVRSAEQLLEQKKWAEAAAVYQGLLARDPSNTVTLYNLGALLAGFHDGGGAPLPDDLAGAADCFTRYLQQKPGDADAAAALAFVKLTQGDADEALPLLAAARNGNPTPKTLSRMGHYYRQAGDEARARECFSQALSLQPKLASAYYGLGSGAAFTADDPHFLRLLALDAERERLTAEDKIYIDFILARAYLAQGETDKAFARYAEGNRLKRGTYPGYDISRFEQHAESLATLFSPAFIAAFRGKAGVQSARPIFVVGMPRSGSTLVDQILCSHPGVSSIGEAPYFAKSATAMRGAELPGLSFSDGRGLSNSLVSSMSPAMLDGVARKYLSLVAAAVPGQGRVVDKMLFNYLWTGVIRLALPNAKIIHCTRDPHDIGLSIWQLLFTADLPWAYDLGDIGRYYKAYAKLMAHWNHVFPCEIHEVNYETMVGDQEAETRRLLAFCGLPWDDRVLRFHETKRHVQTASHSQVRKPIYRDSLAKWRKYEAQLQPLIKALVG